MLVRKYTYRVDKVQIDGAMQVLEAIYYSPIVYSYKPRCRLEALIARRSVEVTQPQGTRLVCTIYSIWR